MLCLMHKMLNLSLKELRLTAKNKTINGYEIMPKDKLLRIFNNKNGDRKSLFKSKIEETKKCLYRSTKNSLFKSKREKTENSSQACKKESF